MVEVAGRRRLVETKVCRVSLFSLLEYISYLSLMNFRDVFFLIELSFRLDLLN